MNRPDPQSDLLTIALDYAGRGWSIIPIRPGTKKPACRWSRWQTTRPDRATLRRWFGRGDVGLAVILGPVSGGLVARDFDDLSAYQRWANEHPDLARTLPTVETVRGRHVYFRAAHDRIVDLGDGELRGAGYCLLPPSRHPDGPAYRWRVALPAGPIPWMDDLVESGFSHCLPCNREDRENGGNRRELRITESTEAMGESGRCGRETTEPNLVPGRRPADPDTPLGRLVLEHLPTGPGRRNRQVFELARVLRALPEWTDAGVENLDALRPVVRLWHNEGVRRAVIRTEPFDETWIDFIQAWPKIRFPKGAEPMADLFESAKRTAPPAAAERYEGEGLRLLVALCRELQRAAGPEPFFLAVRTAGRLLNVQHVTAWRWLVLLTHDRVVEVVESGDRGRHRAARYRYRGD